MAIRYAFCTFSKFKKGGGGTFHPNWVTERERGMYKMFLIYVIFTLLRELWALTCESHEPMASRKAGLWPDWSVKKTFCTRLSGGNVTSTYAYCTKVRFNRTVYGFWLVASYPSFLGFFFLKTWAANKPNIKKICFLNSSASRGDFFSLSFRNGLLNWSIEL